MKLDALVALASSIHSAPGTYALLLGSGVSRTARVPTGWEVVLDLIRRVAVAEGEASPEEPVRWFKDRFGGDPDYSWILEQLAPTAGDRRNLLEQYFEPSAEERDQGIKVPSAAHRAIAELVAGGFVRVILTTNFDRLLEVALVEAGVQPIVIASPSAAVGPIPLAHTRCTVIKVHGDYLDPDLKNTIDELGGYDQAIENLLDRVLDEYGLVVSGWSADWDDALRDALLRCTTHRYGAYWAHRGRVGERASQLIAHRNAVDVEIVGADEFFTDLSSKVTALSDALEQRPLSTALAVAELKRYLPDPVHRIKLHDLVMDEVDRVLRLPSLNVNAPTPTAESVGERMHRVEASMGSLLALLATSSFFADRAEQMT